MIVTLAGHVDHGKTSIVRALTGVDTDRLAEEKRRGLTIDLGFAYTDIDGHRVGFVDVPGHHRFIHNMVAGVAGRQYALLVIAADDGVMPQSREHLQILGLLGLTSGIVALNKTDRAHAERIREVRREVRELTAGSFLHDAGVVELSCATSAGVDELRRQLGTVARSRQGDIESAPFRLAIDRAFTVHGSGVVATGTVVSGTTAIDARLALGSTGKPVRVRGLHVQDAAVTTATAGDRTAVNLAGASRQEVGRGDWLLDPAVVQPVGQFTIALRVLEDFPRAVKHNAPVHVYHATSHSQARLLLIDGAPLAPGAEGMVDASCRAPLQVKVGDRVVLRDHDLERTLGGGRIIDLEVPPAQRRRLARRQRLAAIAPDDAARTLATLARSAAIEASVFARHWNLTPGGLDEVITGSGAQWFGGYLLHPDFATEVGRHIDAAIAAWHRQHPASDGLTAEQICTGDAAARLARRLILAARVEAGAIRATGGHYAAAAHRAAIPAEVGALFAELEAILDHVQPPSLGDIAKRLGRGFTTVERELRALPAFGLALRVGEARYYLPGRLLELADIAIRLDANGPFTVRDFRDASGIGRNVVIEVLEYFDAKGFTRRTGDSRRVIGDRAVLAATQ